jgi:hypothetical protein
LKEVLTNSEPQLDVLGSQMLRRLRKREPPIEADTGVSFARVTLYEIKRFLLKIPEPTISFITQKDIHNIFSAA